ncbi:MAG: hypothetical protein LBP52_01910 [Burkholderiaceae bacterium]|jgi:hypothetical protein|nr:hypothetical protein [Burkholderiaceae bacterium]
MKNTRALLWMVCAAACAPAALAAQPEPAAADGQQPPPFSASQMAQEKARIAQGRQAAQARYAEAEKQCWQKFAVNDCLRKARLERRAQLDVLRQQEWALDDLERAARADARQRALRAKQLEAGGAADAP